MPSDDIQLYSANGARSGIAHKVCRAVFLLHAADCVTTSICSERTKEHRYPDRLRARACTGAASWRLQLHSSAGPLQNYHAPVLGF